LKREGRTSLSKFNLERSIGLLHVYTRSYGCEVFMHGA